MSIPTAFADSLKTVKVQTLFPEKRPAIVSISSTATVAEAFNLLKTHHISSVPVLDKSLAKPRYTAFVDVIDIVAHVVSKMNHDDLVNLQGIPEIFHKFTVADILGASARNPFHPVEEGAPLEVAFKLMAKWHVHRFPVVDAEGNLETIVTQSHVLKYIHDNKYLLKGLLTKTVRELDLGTHPVVTVPETTLLLEVFKTIFQKKLSAVGIVLHDVLVGNLSAADIKNVSDNNAIFQNLHSPVGKFLKVLHNPDAHSTNIYTLRDTATFEGVLEVLVTKRIHRVYITDFESRAVRIISLTDVLDLLFQK